MMLMMMLITVLDGGVGHDDGDDADDEAPVDVGHDVDVVDDDHDA